MAVIVSVCLPVRHKFSCVINSIFDPFTACLGSSCADNKTTGIESKFVMLLASEKGTGKCGVDVVCVGGGSKCVSVFVWCVRLCAPT